MSKDLEKLLEIAAQEVDANRVAPKPTKKLSKAKQVLARQQDFLAFVADLGLDHGKNYILSKSLYDAYHKWSDDPMGPRFFFMQISLKFVPVMKKLRNVKKTNWVKVNMTYFDLLGKAVRRKRARHEKEEKANAKRNAQVSSSSEGNEPED